MLAAAGAFDTSRLSWDRVICQQNSCCDQIAAARANALNDGAVVGTTFTVTAAPVGATQGGDPDESCLGESGDPAEVAAVDGMANACEAGVSIDGVLAHCTVQPNSPVDLSARPPARK